MDIDSLPPLLILVVFLSAFTYISLAEHAGSSGGGILRESWAGPRPWFILFPYKLASIIVMAVAASFFVQAFGIHPWISAAISCASLLVVLVLVHLAASLVVTKSPALSNRLGSPVLTLLRGAGWRATIAQASAGAQAVRAEGSNSGPELVAEPPLDITEEELVGMDRHDREMLRSIIQLDHSTAHEVMVPRLDVVALDVNTSIPQALEPIFRSGHSRIPVFEENIDHIVGVVHSLDLLQLFARDNWSDASLRDLVRQPYFIPETKRLDVLLEEFQQKAVQMAIVVDEYGGTEGIITLEDLLEEIVGEIEDEFSWSEEDTVVMEGGGVVLVNASVTNDVIEEMFGVKLDNPDVDTIGGYVYMNLGRMPHVGDVVETETLNIEITSVLGRRIHKVRVRRKDTSPAQ